MVFHTNAEYGAASTAATVVASPAASVETLRAGSGRSAGEGTSVATRSKSGCSPIAAAPDVHTSGKSRPAITAFRRPAVSSVWVRVP